MYGLSTSDREYMVMVVADMMMLCVIQAEHCRTSLESTRNMNTELSEQIQQYAQKLKDVRMCDFYEINTVRFSNNYEELFGWILFIGTLAVKPASVLIVTVSVGTDRCFCNRLVFCYVLYWIELAWNVSHLLTLH